MAAKEACPENAQLQQMLDGTLPPDGQTKISIHLESCPECQAEFEDLAKKTKLLPDFQVAAGERAESALQRVMEKIAGEGPIAATLCGAPNTEELYLGGILRQPGSRRHRDPQLPVAARPRRRGAGARRHRTSARPAPSRGRRARPCSPPRAPRPRCPRRWSSRETWRLPAFREASLANFAA